MAIQKLHVKGYRSLKDVSWEPGNLNIVIGPNGSGKSNLMRLLELISNSAKGNLQQHIRQEGGLSAISWDGKDDGAGIQLITTDYGALPHDKSSVSRSLFAYNFTFGSFHALQNRILLEALWVLKEKDNSQYDEVTLIECLFNEIAQIFDEKKQTMIKIEEHEMYEESVLSTIKGFLQPQFLTVQLFRNALSNWSFYHYLRTDLDAPIRKPSFTRYDPEIQSDGSNLVSVLHTLYTEDKDFKNNIDLAMKSAFGDEYVELTFGPAADNQIQFRIR